MQTVHNSRNHQPCFSIFVCKQYTTVAITSLVSHFLYANSTQRSQSPALFLNFCLQRVHNSRNHQPCLSLLYANSTQRSQSPAFFLNFCMQTVHNRRNHQPCFSIFVCKQYTTVAITSLVSHFLCPHSTRCNLKSIRNSHQDVLLTGRCSLNFKNH